LLTDFDLVLDDLNSPDDLSIMREWFRQHVSGYIERQEVPSELQKNEQQMKTFVDGVLRAMIDGYTDSCERASIPATHTPRSQGRQTMLQDTPSDKTTTSFSSRSMCTPLECSSPCPQPISGPLLSFEPLQAVLAMDGVDEEGGGRGDIVPSSMAPTSMATVPSFAVSGTLDADNSLGISFLQGLDMNMLVDGPTLGSVLSELETPVLGGDDVPPSFVWPP
jgi:hypothetical protein